MQSYDLLMLFVLGGLGLYGYYKGMAWQVAYLTSFIASYFVAVKFGDRFAPVFGDSAPWNKLLAMGAIYIVTSLGIWIIFRFVRSAIDSAKLNGFDRQMGAAIGLMRGVVWCLGITFVSLTFITRVFPSVQQHIIDSRSGYYIAKFIDDAESIFPPEVHQVIGPYLDRIDQGLDPNQPRPPGFTFQPEGTAAPSGGGFLNGLSGQVANQVHQLQNQVQTGLQNELQNQFQTQLRNAGLPVAGQGSGYTPATPSSGGGGLPAWPASTGAPTYPILPATGAAAAPTQPANPGGWPTPPAGAGWPSR